MSKDLTEYKFPEDLKNMTSQELELLSYSVREFLLDKVSVTGGHLASNLGVVELTIGIHRVFDSPRDKIVWDVGHQSYVHKILTGRADQFDTLRQFGGLSGFPKSNESEHDAFDTGHSSTSISVASGLAAARDLSGEDYQVVAVLGDGSLTGGMSYEAMNNVGASKSNMIVILNDNGMSISRNIGGVSQHLTKLRTSNEYLQVKKTVKRVLSSVPVVGNGLSNTVGRTKDKLKYALLSGGVLFEELGFTYIGPIDGHNIHEIIETLEHAKQLKGPVLIHAITKKGKGYKNAELNPNKFHGIGPFNPETGQLLKPSGTTFSSVFGKTALQLAGEDEKIVAITAAMGDATGLGDFAREFPKRSFDVGIAEAHGVTFAAGLAKGGMKPIIAIYSSFLQRGYDQIIEDVAMQNLPVIFAIDRAGIVGADGETHHGLFDLSFLIPVPNMTILTPCDGNQLQAMIRYAVELKSPVAIRYPRGGCIFREDDAYVFSGKNQRIAQGKTLDIWAVGRMVHTAEKVAALLKEDGINIGIVDVEQVKPLDLSCLNHDVHTIVTLEDGIVTGGFGEMMQVIAPDFHYIQLGWPDQFIQHGDCQSLEREYGLDAQSIKERIGEYLEGKA